jgi:hypothetical protein
MMKKNLLILLAILVVVILAIFLFTQINYNKPENKIVDNLCINAFLDKNLEGGKDYVSGEISVGFTNDVNGVDALNILKKYNLKEPSTNDIIFSRNTYYIEVTSGNSNDFLHELTSSGLFYSADTQLDQYGNPSNIILAYDNLDNTDEQISKFFDSKSQLRISSVDTHAISILVNVPKDSEFEWICKLQEDNKIEYAELNYYYDIDSIE